MAFYELEPWGSHYQDLRAGTIASMIGNVNRDARRQPDPFGPLDFIPWNEQQRGGAQAIPILLDDPEAQSRLIESMMFPRRG